MEPRALFVLVVVILVVFTIYDCVRRKEHPFWIAIIVLFAPYAIGPLIYLAWTRNWVGRLSQSSQAARDRRSARVMDVPGADTPAALHKRGQVLLRQGKHDEAIEVLEEVLLREGPSVPHEVRYDIAMAYKAIVRYRDARDQLSLIVGDDPQYRTGQAFLELADCHYQMNENRRARDLFQQLLKVVRFPEARYKYGILLDHLGDTNGAVEQMRSLLSELDTAPEFHRRNNRRFAKLAKRYLRNHK